MSLGGRCVPPTAASNGGEGSDLSTPSAAGAEAGAGRDDEEGFEERFVRGIVGSKDRAGERSGRFIRSMEPGVVRRE